MDKIFSTRIDESVAYQIKALARRLGTSQKAVVEEAIQAYASEIEQKEGIDLLEQTLGAWQRTESPAETVERVRRRFQRSMMERHRS